MSKISEPIGLTLFVQWELYPFPNPQVSEHKKANKQWALQQTENALTDILGECDIQLGGRSNSMVQIVIDEPESKWKNMDLSEAIIKILEKSNSVLSISIYVNNDISEKIAINMSEHCAGIEYRGTNQETIIYKRKI